MTSLAALTCAALGKGNFESLEIRGMDASLKELVRKNVIYEGAKNMFIFQSPSLFCFGLLELVDIPELIEMAYPVKISCSAK